jgi:endoglucanase
MNNRILACSMIWCGAFAAGGCAGELALDGPETGSMAQPASVGLAPSTVFYAPPPNPGAKLQIKSLKKAGQAADAELIKKMSAVPHAVWLVGGTPKEVKNQVRATLEAAACKQEVPVFVVYNLPFRDCQQYSSGGALDTAAYTAWIDGVVKGLGNSKAVVLLEPDGLGIIPYNTTIHGAEEWCKPTLSDGAGNTVPAPGASAAERYAQIQYAVSALTSKAPKALVYLDSTHSSWLGVGEAAYRLVQAGVQQTRGFFLNVSNYQATSESIQFGTWVSDCIAAGTAGADWALGHFDWCPSQYNADLGYAVDYSPEYAAKVTASLEGMKAGAASTTAFVIDTGRNGQGKWTPASAYPDAQVWCNPPGRGVGFRPSAATGVALLDAFLWGKVPGESDGSCNRGIAGSTTDPEWGGIVDPAAGEWFPEQALELSKLANPPL